MPNLLEMFRCSISLPKGEYRWAKARKTDQPSDPGPADPDTSLRVQVKKELQHEESKPSWYLTPNLESSSYETRNFQLMENPDLYQDFLYLAEYNDNGRLTLPRENVLDFVNKNGPLGGDAQEEIWLPASEPDRHVRTVGESYERWEDEVFALREALELSDALSSNDKPEKLTERFRWEEDGRVFCTKHYRPDNSHGLRAVGWNKRRKKPLISVEEKSVQALEKAARYHLQEIVNNHFSHQIHPAVQLDSELENLSLQLPVTSLLGSVWLQFVFFATAEGAEHRTCEMCPRIFLVESEHGSRSNRQTCSDRCRKRKQRANN